jgi:DNA-binding transcriptional MocR family regulator
VIVTNGCLEAITLALRAVTSPGDTVALESPTYFGFLEILQNLHLKALEIPTDPRTGLSIEALQLALETQPVRAVLAVPTLSNPLGACMPTAARKQLARLLEQHQVPLIEDVIYNDLAESDELRRAVKAWDPSGLVMVCGSFTISASPRYHRHLRLGVGGRWDDEHRRALARVGEIACGLRAAATAAA